MPSPTSAHCNVPAQRTADMPKTKQQKSLLSFFQKPASISQTKLNQDDFQASWLQSGTPKQQPCPSGENNTNNLSHKLPGHDPVSVTPTAQLFNNIQLKTPVSPISAKKLSKSSSVLSDPDSDTEALLTSPKVKIAISYFHPSH